VKHAFHSLFSSALLLGLCIVLNAQKSEYVPQLPENPDIAQESLQAVTSIRSSADLASLIGSIAAAVFTSHTEKSKQLEYQISEASMVRNRIQRLIYMDLKPLLIIRSGLYFHTYRCFNDPALS